MECRTIQQYLKPIRKCDFQESEQNAQIFSKFVLEGKVHSAMRFLSEKQGGGVLDLDDCVDDHGRRTVLDLLEEKHPTARPADADALITTTEAPPEVHPILFQQLTGTQIRRAPLRTQGSAGLSGVDAVGWRRMCTGFNRESNDLCEAIAAVGRRLSTDLVDPKAIQALLACRLIPLDKSPGVSPIGVCEVLRRIYGKQF